MQQLEFMLIWLLSNKEMIKISREKKKSRTRAWKWFRWQYPAPPPPTPPTPSLPTFALRPPLPLLPACSALDPREEHSLALPSTRRHQPKHKLWTWLGEGSATCFVDSLILRSIPRLHFNRSTALAVSLLAQCSTEMGSSKKKNSTKQQGQGRCGWFSSSSARFFCLCC